MSKKLPRKAKKKSYENKSIKYRCDYSSTPLKVLQARGWTRVTDARDTSWDLWWCDTSELRCALDGSTKLRPSQRVAHYRNHSELTRKNYLYRNLRRYKRMLVKAGKRREAEFCDAMPTSFELPSEYLLLVEEYRRRPGSTWIAKPAAGSQGRGIFLFRRLKELGEWRSSLTKCPNDPSALETDPMLAPPTPLDSYVVQRYIDDPYLLEGRKFDLRIYVLVTSFQPLKVWLAREGFARLSSEQFSLERINDNRVHLTNMSIQLKARKQFEQMRLAGGGAGLGFDPHHAEMDEELRIRFGGKLALSSLCEYLTDRHGFEVVDQLLHNIAGVIMASLQAVQPVIIAGKNSFELYGYDVILDERLKPWLLEINASPSLNATDAADFRLKFDLVDDVLNILDFERLLTGRERRVGGFDLLWDDEPVWAPTTLTVDGCSVTTPKRRLNIFLGSPNDRLEQLRGLRARLRHRTSYSPAKPPKIVPSKAAAAVDQKVDGANT